MTALPLAQWRDFYVMIGTASGALVGATFIVATLTSSEKERTVGLRGFISPITVHMGSVLVGSAVLAVPTLTIMSLALLLGAGGIVGTIYAIIVTVRIWRMKLDAADWSMYVILPVLCYAAITVAALIARWRVEWTLDILAASLVTLLVVGMRNAWDMATFMITQRQ